MYDLIGNKGRLVSQEQALPLSRAMIQAELPQHRLLFLSVLQVSWYQPKGSFLSLSFSFSHTHYIHIYLLFLHLFLLLYHSELRMLPV